MRFNMTMDRAPASAASVIKALNVRYSESRQAGKGRGCVKTPPCLKASTKWTDKRKPIYRML